MTAYNDEMRNKDVLTLLGVILYKYNCHITKIDLEQGTLQIKGKNKEIEDVCMYEIQTTFVKMSEEYEVM